MAKAVKEGKSKSEEEQRKVHWDGAEKGGQRRDGAEKSSSKKDVSEKWKKDQSQSQNGKKGGKDQEGKKKVQENGVKSASKKAAAPHKSAVKNAPKDKKKDGKGKGWNNNNNNNNNNSNSKQAKKSVTKPSGQFLRTSIQIILLVGVFPATFLGFLYIVDTEKYRLMCDRGARALNAVVSLLPAEVVAKGQEVAEAARPFVEDAAGKLRGAFNRVGVLLDSNPALKDHWNNINEISSVVGARLAEYMRTVYTQLPIYYDNAKNKLF